jgi:hypothetical protein
MFDKRFSDDDSFEAMCDIRLSGSASSIFDRGFANLGDRTFYRISIKSGGYLRT